jgi:hypothetical protein
VWWKCTPTLLSYWTAGVTREFFRDDGARRRMVLFGKGSRKKNERTNGFILM